MVLNPKTTRLEFLGIFGAVCFIIFIPTIILALQLAITPNFEFPKSISEVNFKLDDFVSVNAFLAVFGWYAYNIILYFLIPGRWIPGTQLRTGGTLLYKINGFQSFLTIIVSTILVSKYHSKILPNLFDSDSEFAPFLWIADNAMKLSVAAISLSFAQSIFLYIYSFRDNNTILALGGNSDYPIYNYFIGRELNPRFGNFDFKYFCELRPGLVGWILLNTSFFIKSYTQHGITNSAVLVWTAQFIYVLDASFFESAILSTMDITTDGFGLMLNIGDLAWVPFTYSLQLRYLAQNPVHLSVGYLGFILFVTLVGLYIFRSSNSQKDSFRKQAPELKKDKNSSKYKFIETKTGSLLLVSGWWGIARHVNYLGDWLMALAWCLPCGFGNPVPYFYAVYFAILLVHRERRDDHKCRVKYGKDWEEYTKLVPYRIVPGIY